MSEDILIMRIQKTAHTEVKEEWNIWNILNHMDAPLMCIWCDKRFTLRESIEKRDYMHLFYCSKECEEAQNSLYGRVKTWLIDHIRCPLYRLYYATIFQFQHREKRRVCPSCGRKMTMETDFLQMCLNEHCPDNGFAACFDSEAGKWKEL